MKKIALLFFTTGIALSVCAQALSDERLILQKCFAIDELHRLYPRQNDGTIVPLQVLQHGVSFPDDINISYLGKQVQFVQKNQITGKSDAKYFLFHEMQIGAGTARASFAYHYSADQVVVVELLFEKAENDWAIVKSKIEKRS